MLDVVVVGAGVVGLTSALRIRQAGARVALVTAVPTELTTSAIAAAVWYPTQLAGEPEVLGWARRGYAVLAAQARRRVGGVALRPTRMLWRTAVTEPPWWAPAVPDLAELAPTQVPAPYAGGWRFCAPVAAMPGYLTWLSGQVRQAGITTVNRRLGSLADVGALAPVVVNATGLAARELCADPDLYPVRGQLVLVENPGLTESVRDQDNPD